MSVANCARMLVLCMIPIVFSSCSSTAYARERQVNAIISESTVLTNAGLYEEAVKLYDAGLVRFPEEKKLRYNYAIALAQAGDLLKAVEVLQQLSGEEESKNLLYLKALGGVAGATQVHDTAIESWERVIELDPMDSKTRIRLMRYLIELNALERAYELGLEAYQLHLFEREIFELLRTLEEQTGSGDGSSWGVILSEL